MATGKEIIAGGAAIKLTVDDSQVKQQVKKLTSDIASKKINIKANITGSGSSGFSGKGGKNLSSNMQNVSANLDGVYKAFETVLGNINSNSLEFAQTVGIWGESINRLYHNAISQFKPNHTINKMLASGNSVDYLDKDNAFASIYSSMTGKNTKDVNSELLRERLLKHRSGKDLMGTSIPMRPDVQDYLNEMEPLDRGMINIGKRELRKDFLRSTALRYGKIATGVAGLGVGAAYAGAAYAGSKYVDKASDIRKLSMATGLSAKDASVANFAFGDDKARNLFKGTQMFLRSASEGNADDKARLQKLGLDNKQFQNMSSGDQMMSLWKSVASIKDGSERAQMALRVFGEGATEVLDKLARGGNYLDDVQKKLIKSGGMVSDADLQKIASLEKSKTELKMVFDGLITKVGKEMVPVFQGLTEGAIGATKALSFIAGITVDKTNALGDKAGTAYGNFLYNGSDKKRIRQSADDFVKNRTPEDLARDIAAGNVLPQAGPTLSERRGRLEKGYQIEKQGQSLYETQKQMFEQSKSDAFAERNQGMMKYFQTILGPSNKGAGLSQKAKETLYGIDEKTGKQNYLDPNSNDVYDLLQSGKLSDAIKEKMKPITRETEVKSMAVTGRLSESLGGYGTFEQETLVVNKKQLKTLESMLTEFERMNKFIELGGKQSEYWD